MTVIVIDVDVEQQMPVPPMVNVRTAANGEQTTEVMPEELNVPEGHSRMIKHPLVRITPYPSVALKPFQRENAGSQVNVTDPSDFPGQVAPPKPVSVAVKVVGREAPAQHGLGIIDELDRLD